MSIIITHHKLEGQMYLTSPDIEDTELWGCGTVAGRSRDGRGIVGVRGLGLSVV